MVKDIIPFTKNNLYREFFEEFYDFSDASNYKLTRGVSGVNPNITFPSKDLSVIQAGGLNVNNYTLTQLLLYAANYTVCLVMTLWLNRSFEMKLQQPAGRFRTKSIILRFSKTTKKLTLRASGSSSITITNSFNGKKVVLWLEENSNANIAKHQYQIIPQHLYKMHLH